MNITTPQFKSRWPARSKYAILVVAAAALVLAGFGFHTGHPVSFLKWFFGLQADD